MPNFPPSATVTTKKTAVATLKDASGKEVDVQFTSLPIAATTAQIDALIAATGDMSNAGMHKNLIAETREIPEGDILALDDAESSLTARALMLFQNASLQTRAFVIPAPDISLFDPSGEAVLPPASSALVSAYVAAALAVLNAGGDTYAYVSGERIDTSYIELSPVWEAIAKAQDDANKALLDSASALAASAAASAAADDAQMQANLGVSNAAAAQSAANNAQVTAAFAYPNRITVFGDELIWTVGTPNYSLNQPAFPYDYLIWTNTDLASCYADVLLKAGTWTFILTSVARNDAAKVTIRLGVPYLANPLEMYSAAALNGRRTVFAGIVIAASDILRLTFTVAGHTSPSTGYLFAPLKFHGYKTA